MSNSTQPARFPSGATIEDVEREADAYARRARISKSAARDHVIGGHGMDMTWQRAIEAIQPAGTNENWYWHAQSEIAPVLRCWPESLDLLAERLDVSRQSLDKTLEGEPFYSYADVYPYLKYLNVSLTENTIDADGSFFFQANGPYLLAATTEKDTSACFDLLSHGGDLMYAQEILPRIGAQDATHRYLLFAPCFDPPSLMIFEVGGAAEQLLDAPDALINYEGQARVDHRFYDGVATIAGLIETTDYDLAFTLWQSFVAHHPYIVSLQSPNARHN